MCLWLLALDWLIADGLIDFWEVCRPFLADPMLLRKLEEDRIEDIRPCIGCMMCLAKLFANQPYICTVSPVLGHEMEPEYHAVPAVRNKKVMIVGGGPAGMECAINASRRGHEVTIFEKKDRLGGQVISASKEIKGGSDLGRLIKSYETEIEKNGIKVNLNTEVNRSTFGKEKPDVIVVATGAEIMKPNIPGIDRDNVMNAWDVLERDTPTAGRVAIIGGGKVGLILAEHLASGGKEVWIVESQKRVDYDVSSTFKWRHAAWVKEFGINVLNLTLVIEVTEKGLLIQDEKNNQRELEAETIIMAGPRVAIQELSASLEYIGDEVYLVGDAIKPRSIHNAIHEGYKLGLRV
jgi:2,4-dienoyl-CoA reductase (NADPH2)